MTVIGAHVLAPDLAVCWADSEQYDLAGRSLGMTGKLFVNPAGFAFAMAGLATVAQKGAAAVAKAPTMREALRELPHVLRRAGEQAAISCGQPERYGGLWGALIGWDQDGSAMHAYRFTGGECFVPMLDYKQAVPEPRTGLSPNGPHFVRLIAEQQLDLLRSDGKLVRGGPLHVAVIRPDGITCSRICDLANPETAREKELP